MTNAELLDETLSIIARAVSDTGMIATAQLFEAELRKRLVPWLEPCPHCNGPHPDVCDRKHTLRPNGAMYEEGAGQRS